MTWPLRVGGLDTDGNEYLWVRGFDFYSHFYRHSHCVVRFAVSSDDRLVFDLPSAATEIVLSASKAYTVTSEVPLH